MGMSSYVVGFRPPDETWERMKTVWNACKAAGIAVPPSVDQFFDGTNPNDRPGLQVSVMNAVTKYTSDMADGFELDVMKLPPGVKIVRFVNSY